MAEKSCLVVSDLDPVLDRVVLLSNQMKVEMVSVNMYRLISLPSPVSTEPTLHASD